MCKALSVGALSEVILSSHPITMPLLPLTSSVSEKTWELCGECNLKITSPCSSMNCPSNIVRGHYAGFRGWRTSVLVAPKGPRYYSQVSHSSTPQLALHRMWWEGPGCVWMNLPQGPWRYHCVSLLQNFYYVTAEVSDWKMCLLKATFKWPQSKCRRVSMSIYNENMR